MTKIVKGGIAYEHLDGEDEIYEVMKGVINENNIEMDYWVMDNMRNEPVYFFKINEIPYYSYMSDIADDNNEFLMKKINGR